MKRYPKAEVDAALEQTERNHTTVHGQLVLAGEVIALRAASRVGGWEVCGMQQTLDELRAELEQARSERDTARANECRCWAEGGPRGDD